jgi:hypothetical protein
VVVLEADVTSAGVAKFIAVVVCVGVDMLVVIVIDVD